MPVCAASDYDPLADQRVLNIDFFVKPGEMAAPGAASMTFIISNRSDFDIQNVYLASADGSLSEPLGLIEAGETQNLSRPHSVTQEELDAGMVTYIISHDPLIDGSEKITYTVSAPVIKSDARAEMDFTRQVSSDYISRGSIATITYKIRNTGNVRLSNIRIRDSLGDFTGKLDHLDVGATKTFISRVTIADEAASAPELEYDDASGKTITRTLEPLAIHLSQNMLETAFSVGTSPFNPSTADAILTLRNSGNSDYRDITVADDVYGGVIADSITLPKGAEPVDVAYTYPLRSSGDYRWRITGVNEAGERINLVTETVSLLVEEPIDDIGVEISAAARTPVISRGGYVTFDIEIRNTGTHMAQDVLLYEVNLGPVRRLAVLPTGDPTRCTVQYDVQTDSQFIFCLNYTDENGHARTVSTAPIGVEIASGGEMPELSGGNHLDLDGDSVKIGTSSAFLILLGSASALLVVLFIILTVTSLRLRREHRQRIAAEKQRIKEEMGKTNQFTPLKYLNQKKK